MTMIPTPDRAPDDAPLRREIPIISEQIEPFAGMLLSRLFARCVEAKKADHYEFEDACANLWMGVLGLQKICIAVRTATHFGVACGNHMGQVARYIEEELGVRPFEEWKW